MGGAANKRHGGVAQWHRIRLRNRRSEFESRQVVPKILGKT
jgi:hypothetical protein